jgi:hypothetical protein
MTEFTSTAHVPQIVDDLERSIVHVDELADEAGPLQWLVSQVPGSPEPPD